VFFYFDESGDYAFADGGFDCYVQAVLNALTALSLRWISSSLLVAAWGSMSCTQRS
jgi:hypothetical protein